MKWRIQNLKAKFANWYSYEHAQVAAQTCGVLFSRGVGAETPCNVEAESLNIARWYMNKATVSCKRVSGHPPASFLVHRTVWPLSMMSAIILEITPTWTTCARFSSYSTVLLPILTCGRVDDTDELDDVWLSEAIELLHRIWRNNNGIRDNDNRPPH